MLHWEKLKGKHPLEFSRGRENRSVKHAFPGVIVEAGSVGSDLVVAPDPRHRVDTYGMCPRMHALLSATACCSVVGNLGAELKLARGTGCTACILCAYHVIDPPANIRTTFLIVPFFGCIRVVFGFPQEGGALWIGVTGVVKFLKRSKATFQSNSGPGNGGTINNYGVLVMRNTASFNQGRSTDGSGGCISCGPASEMV